VEGVRAIVIRFPQLELQIRRRCSHDPRFASVCRDYGEAASALRHWRQQAAGDRRVREYEQILAELEAEVLAALGGRSAAARSP